VGGFFCFVCFFLSIAENVIQRLSFHCWEQGQGAVCLVKSSPPFSMPSTYLRLKIIMQINLMKNCLDIKKISCLFGKM